MEMNKEEHILQSWARNADNWIDVISREKIESRKLVTNRAIVETILKYHPLKVLDLGCGEGWLARSLNQQGIETIGVDGTEGLILSARVQGGGQYEVLSYEDIIAGSPLPGAPFEGIAINFSLFTEDSTGTLLQALKRSLSPGGMIFIQTLHPYFQIDKGQAYRSQWYDNSWDGLEGGFTEPHHWFCRTMGDWLNLFVAQGFQLVELQEPLNPKTQKPASALFVVLPDSSPKE